MAGGAAAKPSAPERVAGGAGLAGGEELPDRTEAVGGDEPESDRLPQRVFDLARRGVELVDLAFRRSGGSSVLRLDIDRAGTTGVGIEDCQRVSRAMSDALDESAARPTIVVVQNWFEELQRLVPAAR